MIPNIPSANFAMNGAIVAYNGFFCGFGSAGTGGYFWVIDPVQPAGATLPAGVFCNALSVKGGAALSRQQLDDKGLNDSLIHEDVMIGTPGMKVTGITLQGGRVPLMEKGEWVI